MIQIDPEMLKARVQQISGVGEATAGKIKETAQELDEGPTNPSVDVVRMKRAVDRMDERTLYKLIDDLE